tara:strand:+ start:30367 stop:30678 length:312 start_codon:yes stop_codon:yes gene_type:complete
MLARCWTALHKAKGMVKVLVRTLARVTLEAILRTKSLEEAHRALIKSSVAWVGKARMLRRIKVLVKGKIRLAHRDRILSKGKEVYRVRVRDQAMAAVSTLEYC